VLEQQTALGSEGRNGKSAEQQMEEARRLAINVDAPLYRVSGKWRTSILIGDATPAACTLADRGPPLVIPDSVARAAGLVAAKDVPRQRYTAADGRSLELRVVKVPRIRIGGRVISQVEAWLLPPEAEDLGVLLSRQYLGGYQFELDPAKLRLVLH